LDPISLLLFRFILCRPHLQTDENAVLPALSVESLVAETKGSAPKGEAI
jgi:hypothetical protein